MPASAHNPHTWTITMPAPPPKWSDRPCDFEKCLRGAAHTHDVEGFSRLIDRGGAPANRIFAGMAMGVARDARFPLGALSVARFPAYEGAEYGLALEVHDHLTAGSPECGEIILTLLPLPEVATAPSIVWLADKQRFLPLELYRAAGRDLGPALLLAVQSGRHDAAAAIANIARTIAPTYVEQALAHAYSSKCLRSIIRAESYLSKFDGAQLGYDFLDALSEATEGCKTLGATDALLDVPCDAVMHLRDPLAAAGRGDIAAMIADRCSAHFGGRYLLARGSLSNI